MYLLNKLTAEDVIWDVFAIWDIKAGVRRGDLGTDLEKETEDKSPEQGHSQCGKWQVVWGCRVGHNWNDLAAAAAEEAGQEIQNRYPEGGFIEQWAVRNTKSFYQETYLVRMVLSILPVPSDCHRYYSLDFICWWALLFLSLTELGYNCSL